MKKKKNKKSKILKLLKGKVRKDFIAQGGNDGRFATKIVPDKKRKYNGQKTKKIKEE